jgi:hypothetical protein
MELALILLVGTLMGAFNFGFFCLGYYVRDKKNDDDVLEVTNENAESVKKIMEWMNYGGKQ